jgi:hypothetical protein
MWTHKLSIWFVFAEFFIINKQGNKKDALKITLKPINIFLISSSNDGSINDPNVSSLYLL